jgi:hypothetical protein
VSAAVSVVVPLLLLALADVVVQALFHMQTEINYNYQAINNRP